MIAAEGVSLFIVDDDPSVRTSLTRLLRAEGVEPLCFATAEEFLDHLPAVNGPSCALLNSSPRRTAGCTAASTISR